MSTASPARIAANKANALKSTGPRTESGKARVSENAMKHGLRSQRNPLDLANDAALPFEREEFLNTLTAFMEEFAPACPFEVRLVERLAQIDLRLNRAVRMETTHFEMHIGMLTRSMAGALPSDEQTQHAWLATLAFLKNPSATTLIAQYESRLARDFARTLAQLRQAQKVRAQSQVQQSRNQTQAETTSAAGAEALTVDAAGLIENVDEQTQAPPPHVSQSAASNRGDHAEVTRPGPSLQKSAEQSQTSATAL